MPGVSTLSLWDETAEESDTHSPMRGDVTTDVAIVGGGYTGLSTALHAAERGLECCVLEARQIGFGGSGRNVGLLNAGLWLPPQDVRAKLGGERGARLVDILGEGPAYVMSLIEKHQIRCELTRSGTIHAAHSANGFMTYTQGEEWARSARRCGASRQETMRRSRQPTPSMAACSTPVREQLKPIGYEQGLARVAKGCRGAHATERRQLQKTSSQPGEWLLKTGEQCVGRSRSAGPLSLFDGHWPGIEGSFVPIISYRLRPFPSVRGSPTSFPSARASGTPAGSCSRSGAMRPTG